MATYLAAMAVALAVRDGCKRKAENGWPIGEFNLDAIVARVLRHAATCLPCPDDVFEGIAKAIQAQSGCTYITALVRTPA